MGVIARGLRAVAQAQALEHLLALCQGHGHANHALRARQAQRHGFALGLRHNLIHDRTRLATTDIQNQLRDALEVVSCGSGVHATLKAVRSIGREVVTTGTTRDGGRPPERGFQVDIAGVITHGGGIAAHHACQRLDLVVIGDHTHLLIQRHGLAIEQLQSLAGFGPTHRQTAVDLVEVEHMRRLAQLEHHIVRDVDQWGHGALAAARQSLDHPIRCLGLRVHAMDDAAHKAPTQISRVDLDGNGGIDGGLHRHHFRQRQGRAGQSRDLARNALHAQAMRQVGRELEGEQRVIQLEVVANVLAQGRIFGQDVQAIGFFRNAQLACRAQHALALDTTQLAQLDLEHFAIGAGWQLGPHGGARHFDAWAHIGRAAHDLQDRTGTRIDLTDVQTVGIGVLADFQHMTHHHAGERRSDGVQLFHFQARHGEQVGQLLRGQIRVAEATQPRLRELHERILGSCSSTGSGLGEIRIQHDPVARFARAQMFQRIVDATHREMFSLRLNPVSGREFQHGVDVLPRAGRRARHRPLTTDQYAGLNGHGLRHDAHHMQSAVRTQCTHQVFPVQHDVHGHQDHVELTEHRLHRGGVDTGHHTVSTHLQRLIALGLAGRERGDFAPPCLGEFDGQVTQATNAHHTYTMRGLDVEVQER